MIDVLTSDPHDLDKGWDVRRTFPGMTVRYAVGLRRDIEQFLHLATGQGMSGSIGAILGELTNDIPRELAVEPLSGGIDENDSAIVRLTNQVIVEADRLGASDIHIEPYADRKDVSVRLRVDGTCFTYMRIPAACRRAVVSRIKVMAHLDIAERRKPQDGKIRYRLPKDREIEIRVATLPTSGQDEDVVLRLLTAKQPMSLEVMEFAPATVQALRTLAEKPHGIILCVGPTGSGKTTTLHAILKHINTDERKIWTAEDPIEITQDGLRQVQVHPKIDLTFATAMRAFLRADPDVIMIGEMRDKETADIAIEASLTGHLVLSTLHTNSAVETVIRLLDLGCDPFNFADAMLGVLAQRLCKRICSRCKEAYHPSRQEYDELVQGYGAQDWPTLGIEYRAEWGLYRGRGCEFCNGTGFKGRVPLHELLLPSEGMKQLIQTRSRTAEMLALAMNEGMVTLVQDGIRKVLQGFTTYRQARLLHWDRLKARSEVPSFLASGSFCLSNTGKVLSCIQRNRGLHGFDSLELAGPSIREPLTCVDENWTIPGHPGRKMPTGTNRADGVSRDINALWALAGVKVAAYRLLRLRGWLQLLSFMVDMKQLPAKNGFTLIEMMIVCAIIGISSAIAVTNFSLWHAQYQLKQAVTEIQSQLNMSRIAAMNRNAVVNVNLTLSGGLVELSASDASGGSVIGSTKMMGSVTGLNPAPTAVAFSPLGIRSGGGVGNQQIVLSNNRGLSYAVRITPRGNITWCPASTCP